MWRIRKLSRHKAFGMSIAVPIVPLTYPPLREEVKLLIDASCLNDERLFKWPAATDCVKKLINK
jgi:hypothetical protein